MPNNVTVYVMTVWQNLPSKNTALEATNLNHLEQGIKNVTDFVNTINATSGLYLSQTPFTTALKNKLDGIEAQANKYVLPTASNSTLGGVKVDAETITIDQNGVIHAAAATTQLSALTDVNLEDLADGQILKYDATEGKWVNTSEAEVRTQLSLLEDVDIDDPQDGETLKYNATTEKWENGTGGDVLNYDDTLDVLGLPPNPIYVYENMLPKMSADSQDGYVLDASSTYGGRPKYLAFDGNPATFWSTNNQDMVGSWIQIKLPEAIVVPRASVQNASQTGYYQIAKGFKFQGSNDTETWDDLVTVTDNPKEYGYEYSFDNPSATAYMYYRILCTDRYSDDPASTIAYSQIKFYRKVII